MRRPISDHVIRRLPRYLRKLEELAASDITRVSSSELARSLGLTATQVRQDLSAFGSFGHQGYGYSVCELQAEIAKILGMNRRHQAILIGVGNIGDALLEKFAFHDWGVQLAAAFDIKSALIGTVRHGVPVCNVAALPNYLSENPTDIAVLCVPKDQAIPMTEMLTSLGIDAIWNFTNVDIVGPRSRVIVENVHFSDSLLSLSYFLAERQDEKARPKPLSYILGKNMISEDICIEAV